MPMEERERERERGEGGKSDPPFLTLTASFCSGDD